MDRGRQMLAAAKLVNKNKELEKDASMEAPHDESQSKVYQWLQAMPCYDMENDSLLGACGTSSYIPKEPALLSTGEESYDDSVKDPDYFTPIKENIFADDEDNSSENSGELPKDDIGNNRNNIERNPNIPDHANEKQKGAISKNRDKIKEARRTGTEYTTSSNKNIAAKQVVPLQPCRKKCSDRISCELAFKLFHDYHSLENYKSQVTYLSSLIRLKTPCMSNKRSNVSPSKERTRAVTIEYFIQNKAQQLEVCKGCFMKIFAVTANQILSIQQKKRNSESGIILADQRGKAANPTALKENDRKAILAHINEFPTYESHYTRKRSALKYLGQHLTLDKMYQLYREKHPNIAKSKSTYSRIFYETKLKFKTPQINTCSKCDNFKVHISVAQNEEKNELINQRNQHHNIVEMAYNAKRNDKEEALHNDTKRVYAFDLQQCLPTPALNAGISFYKRSLWTFNLSFHDLVSGKVICFMWDESTGGRGANQIASCIFYLIKSLPQTVKHIVLYSDSCSGQNKNNHVAAMFFTLLEICPWLDCIDHKFLVPGHTHMECDSDHALIERKKKRTELEINIPHDWMQLVRTVGIKKPFSVIEMTQEHFYDFAVLLKGPLIARKINENNESFYWHDTVWLRYENIKPKKLLYKQDYSLESDFSSVSFLRKGKVPRLAQNVQLQYSGPLPISREKKNDLLALRSLIRPEFHPFYENLLATGDVPDIDPDLEEFSSE